MCTFAYWIRETSLWSLVRSVLDDLNRTFTFYRRQAGLVSLALVFLEEIKCVYSLKRENKMVSLVSGLWYMSF
jgi:hypothetical protein